MNGEDQFDETALRDQLKDLVAEQIVVIEIAAFEPLWDSPTEPVTVLQRFRRNYEGRLRALQKAAPDRPDLHEQCRAVLSALDLSSPDENLYHWSARSKTCEYSGASTPSRLIEFLSVRSKPNAHTA